MVMTGSSAELVNISSERFYLCQFCTVLNCGSTSVDPSQQELGIRAKIYFDIQQNLTDSGEPFKAVFLATGT